MSESIARVDHGETQSVGQHLQETARRATKFCEGFDWSNWAYLAGLWHDLGKYSDAFQQRIRHALQHPEQARPPSRVDHSTAGAQHAANKLGTVGKLLAYAIAGHHAGLSDGKSADSSCLNRRLQKTIPEWHSGCPAEILDASVDLQSLPFPAERTDPAFGVSFFIRMLFSCIVDADRLDAEAFGNPDAADQRVAETSLQELDARLRRHLDSFQTTTDSESDLNRTRHNILLQCIAASQRRQGLFSLTVPTGGGKTLSSLAFALKHAIRHGMKRVIYVIPYTSIIEQNAKVFRNALGVKDDEQIVLEHHSSFDPHKDYKDDPLWENLAAENWDAPIIVTTNVQFFESLFSSRPSRCRKLHNIMNSVVILDEAQMLPVNLLRPCLAALKELTSYYHTSIVLCTATQPALKKEDDFHDGLDDVLEIIEQPQQLYKDLKRTQVQSIAKITDEDLKGKLSQHERVLCIVNTRAHARSLYEHIRHLPGARHLSALMCPEHRSRVLETIRTDLNDGKQCRVISTQLIEAGVDVDFPVVYRASAGIDSIAQAAGRCNREGKLASAGNVYVFEAEGGLPPGNFRHAAETAESVARHHPADPLGLEAVREYFRDYYWLKGDQLDKNQVLEMIREGILRLSFPFREIDNVFRVIDENSCPVIVPWSTNGRRLANQLREGTPSRNLIRKLQRYTVNLQPRQFACLRAANAIETLHENYFVLDNEDLYFEETGLYLDDPSFHKPENLCI